jgi:hypothetical protein
LTDVKATYERQLEDLYAEIGRLTTHVNFLKKTVRAMAPYVPAIVSYTGSW